MGPNALVNKVIKTPIQTVIVNPNAHDFFIPLNIPYIMQRCNDSEDVMEFSIEDNKENKELSIYEMDAELKKYVFSPDGFAGEGPDSEDI